MTNRKILFSISSILIITSIAFFPSLQNNFTNWDDPVYVTENAKIKELSWKNIIHIFTSNIHGFYKPLTELSFAIEYHFFGLNPHVYHATNLLLHLLNCLLVFWLIFILSKSVGVSFITALFFGIHPLHVESVAWISERKDVLYAFFFLASLISYLFYHRKNAIKYYYFSLFLFLLSLLPKPQGIFLPVVLLLFDYFLGRKFNRKTLFEKIPFFLISLVFVIIAIVGQSAAGELGKEELITLFPNLLNATYGLIFYLVKLAVPTKLSCFYPYPDQMGEVTPLLFLFSPFILTSLTAVVIFSLKYTRKVIFAGLFFLINLLMVLQVIPTCPAIAADRYTYIPSIGIFYLAGVGFFWLYNLKFRYPKLAKSFLFVVLTIIISLFSFLTWQRCRVWKDSTILWNEVLKKYANIPLAHNNLGLALVEQGKLKEALSHYNEALLIKPDYAEAHNNLGNVLTSQDKLDLAITHYIKALQIKPDSAQSLNNLGLALAEQGKIDEAIAHYSEALRIKPGSEQAHNNLGNALAKHGKLEEAIVHLKEALRIKPDYAEARNNLGIVLVRQDKIEEAITHLNESLRIKPGSEQAHNNLGNALAKHGKLEEAIVHLKEALRIKPDYAEARNNLGIILVRQDKIEEAITHFNEALRIKPDYLQALNNLGNTLIKQGKFKESVQTFEKGLKLKPDSSEILCNLADAFIQQDEIKEGLKFYRRALEKNPIYEEGYIKLAVALYQLKRYEEIVQVWESGLSYLPNHPLFLNYLAWILATCPEDELRDCSRAIDLARKANRQTRGKHPSVLDTLAAAYADCGQFDRALKIAQEAIESARQTNDEKLERDIGMRLKLYQRRIPFRDLPE